MSEVRTVSDKNFEADVLSNDRPTVVDFWAEWCGPCRLMSPEVEKLADRYSGSIDVFKMDVDANSKIPMRFGIMSIPTVMLFAPGQRPVPAIGYRPLEELEKALKLSRYVSTLEAEA